MIDLFFLAHNRRAFTAKTLDLLARHTNWDLVKRVFLYDDASEEPGARELLQGWIPPRNSAGAIDTTFIAGGFGGPVAAMLHYINFSSKLYWADSPPPADPIFAKIDNDTAVPARWLDVAWDVMQRYPDLQLLGIEAMTSPVAWKLGERARSFDPSQHIGGIGLMRMSAFADRPQPRPAGRFGFTEWQHFFPEVTRGFLLPALPVVLLDRVPMAPWDALTRSYVDRGWARAWGPYDAAAHADWEWVNALDD